jgi:hypothetical protein
VPGNDEYGNNINGSPLPKNQRIIGNNNFNTIQSPTNGSQGYMQSPNNNQRNSEHYSRLYSSSINSIAIDHSPMSNIYQGNNNGGVPPQPLPMGSPQQ